jgi:hypothetical protein
VPVSFKIFCKDLPDPLKGIFSQFLGHNAEKFGVKVHI